MRVNPGYSKNLTTIDEINQLAYAKKENDADKLDKNHWAYKRLVNITEKHGLLVGNSENFFDSNKALSRNEAAVILVNLIGKIREENTAMSEVEQEQIQILKEEFKKEIDFISGRVEKLESNVTELQGRVATIEKSDAKDVKFGFGEKMQLQALLKFKYTGLLDRGTTSDKANFDVPQARIRILGNVHKNVGYVADFNAHTTFTDTTKRAVLNNAYVWTDIIPHHKVQVGQFWLPIGEEGPCSPENLDLAEKSQISRNFSNLKDTGAQIQGNTKFVDYKAAVFNGQGYNSADTVNSSMDYGFWGVVKPLALHPEYGSLKLGGGYYNGSLGTGTRATTFASRNHDTASYYAEYRYKKLGLKGEYAVKDGYSSTYNKKADGFYAQTDYFLTDKIQLLARYDTFRRDIDIINSESKEYTAGLNYFMNNKNLKFQFNYVFVDNYTPKNGQKLIFLTQYLL